jgi:gluconolactonase
VPLRDGRIVSCDGLHGRLAVTNGEVVSEYASVGGVPNGAALGRGGAIYCTQVGGLTMHDSASVSAGIQRVLPDRSLKHVLSRVDGIPLVAPNDLAFGPDGRLYFTDPGGPYDTGKNKSPSRIFGVSSDQGELIIELENVYCNGIAFDSSSRLVWTESFTRRICRLEPSGPEVLCELPEGCVPDGLAIAADGRLFVATLTSGGVSVVGSDGVVLDHVENSGLQTVRSKAAHFSSQRSIRPAASTTRPNGKDRSGQLKLMPSHSRCFAAFCNRCRSL